MLRAAVIAGVTFVLEIVFDQFWAVLATVAAFYAVRYLLSESVPSISVETTEEEEENVLEGRKKFDPSKLKELPKTNVYCWDPSTLDDLGTMPVSSEKDVQETVAAAKKAQEEWSKSSFDQRRRLLKIMLRYIVENQETIARVAVRDSGKTMVDACFGEVLVTCEKLKWVIEQGEKYLQPEHRQTGTLMMMKKVRVEYRPMGVIGAIVPWNYPFHNVFNPIIAAVFGGNAIVIKVSEYASWSSKFYNKVLQASLAAAGAPVDLVQFVHGYADTGNALVTGGVDKIIFVGSPAIGKKVMEAAAPSLTPVILELGGKDPFVVLEDADLDAVVQIATRGVFQNMGQNCAGPERFFVYESIFDEYCDKIQSLVKRLKTGASLQSAAVDCGAVTMGRGQMAHYQKLVDDAVSNGAKLLAGGYIPGQGDELYEGSFYPPTVLADVPEAALIAQEEIFGPIMCIFKVKKNSDKEAVRMANNCDFALSSCAFSKNIARARKVASQLKAGMSAVNDLEGTTYMSQSLPFGGHGLSGFGRFAGPEGLRGFCHVRSVCEDLIPAIRTTIPPPLQYPSNGNGQAFATSLIQLFYGYGLAQKAMGVINIIKASAAAGQ